MSGVGPEPGREAIEDEKRRARALRVLVDLTAAILAQSRLSRSEAEDLVASTRRRALQLFPDKEDTYDLILAPRFARLMEEFVGPPAPRARVLRFPRFPD